MIYYLVHTLVNHTLLTLGQKSSQFCQGVFSDLHGLLTSVCIGMEWKLDLSARTTQRLMRFEENAIPPAGV